MYREEFVEPVTPPKRKRTVVPSRPYEDDDDCRAAAVDDFIRRRKVARWRVSAEWADEARENIAIFY